MNHSELFNLTGKTAIITGGANGIGKASCEILAAAGANVVVSDYNLEAARVVAENIIKNGGKAIALVCDVTKDEDLVNLINTTIKEFGTIEILVNNVGGGGAGRESPDQIDVNHVENKVWKYNKYVFYGKYK